jgi:hypothetical protein
VALAQRRSASVVLLAESESGMDVRVGVRGTAALDWLARLQRGGVLPWPELVRRGIDHIPRHGRLYVLTTVPLVDDDLLSRLQARGVDISVSLFDVGSFVVGDGDLPRGAGADDPQEAAGPRGFEAGDYELAARQLRERSIGVRIHRRGDDVGQLRTERLEEMNR